MHSCSDLPDAPLEISDDMCLLVRETDEGLVIATETALSRLRGLSIGEPIKGKRVKGDMICVECESLTPASLRRYLEELQLTPAEFSQRFGVNETAVQSILEGSDQPDGPKTIH